MIPPLLAWLLTCLGFAILGAGIWLLAWHRGYVAGRLVGILEHPPEPWAPPTEAEFLAELLEAERLQPTPPSKYRREP